MFWGDRKKVFLAFFILFSIAILLAFFGIHICYTFIFFIGYAYGKDEADLSGRKYITLSGIMLAAMCLRIITRQYLDGSIIYNDLIVNYTHMVLGMWIIVTIQIIYRKNKTIVDPICETKIWKTLNRYTMPIYISHYAFLVGNINVAHLNVGVGLKIGIFAGATIIFAYLIRNITDAINSSINNCIAVLN